MKQKLLLSGILVFSLCSLAFKRNSITKIQSHAESLSIRTLYEKLQAGKVGLKESVFTQAMTGFQHRSEKKIFKRTDVITIIDFSMPSVKNRLFVIDLLQEKLLYCTLVAHGKGSGYILPDKFSNTPESLQSSLGFYTTKGTYEGHNGISLVLKGLDYGINHLAEDRGIVMHGADYVSTLFIQKHGYLGRSWGCPAVSREMLPKIINSIKGGSCLFVYAAS